MNKNYYVYGLVDPRDFRLKYIGRTVKTYNDPNNFSRRMGLRLEGHYTEATKRNSDSPKNQWLNELIDLGLAPITVCLGEGTDNGKEEEKTIGFISSINKSLLNVTNSTLPMNPKLLEALPGSNKYYLQKIEFDVKKILNIISTNGKVAETAETVECDNCHNYHSEYTVYSKWIIDKKVCRNFCDDCLTSVFIDTLVENGFNYEKIVLRQPLIAELEKEQ